MRKIKLSWLLDSWAYRKAKRLVDATVASPERLLSLASRAQSLKILKEGRFADILESSKASFRLISCYAKGDYRDISLQSFGLIVASVIYFVMPLDSLPDFILGIGFIDDAALLTWTLKTVAADLEKFVEWERKEATVIDAEFDMLEQD